MNKRRLIPALLFFAGVITVEIVWFVASSEPRHQGKRLTEWWDEIDAPADPSVGRDAVHRQFTNLAMAVGPRALSFYVACLDYKPPARWRENLAAWIETKSSGRIQFARHKDRTGDAFRSIEVLGPAAVPIIPDLARLMLEGKYPWSAAWSLGSIGPQALPALSNVVATTTNHVARASGVVVMGHLGTAARPAAPLLYQLIERNESFYAIHLANLSLSVLVESETNRIELLPLLTAQLARTNSAFGACFGLLRMGSPGIPVLLQSLTNESAGIRIIATAALEIGSDPRFGGTATFMDLHTALENQRTAIRAWDDLEQRMAAVLMYYSTDANAECRMAASYALVYLRAHDAQALAEIPESSP